MAWKPSRKTDETWRKYLTVEEEKELKELDKVLADIRSEQKALRVRRVLPLGRYTAMRMRGTQREHRLKRTKD